MNKINEKIQQLKAQAGGYLILARGHALEGNTDQARLYINKHKELMQQAAIYRDPDATDAWTAEDLFSMVA